MKSTTRCTNTNDTEFNFNILDNIDPNLSFYKKSLLLTEHDMLSPRKIIIPKPNATSIVMNRIKFDKDNYINKK